jgi:plastocyanin
MLRRTSIVALVLGFVFGGTAMTAIAQAQQPEPVTVVISESGVDRSTVQLTAGSSIDLVNHDSQSHTIAVSPPEGGSQDVGTVAPGQAITVTFNDPGRHTWRSTTDSNINGEVLVGASRSPATGTPTAPGRSGVDVSEPREVAGSPTPQIDSQEPATSEPEADGTPAVPVAGGLGLVSSGDGQGVSALALVAAGMMLLAMSSLMLSAVRSRLTIEGWRSRDRRH